MFGKKKKHFKKSILSPSCKTITNSSDLTSKLVGSFVNIRGTFSIDTNGYVMHLDTEDANKIRRAQKDYYNSNHPNEDRITWKRTIDYSKPIDILPSPDSDGRQWGVIMEDWRNNRRKTISGEPPVYSLFGKLLFIDNRYKLIDAVRSSSTSQKFNDFGSAKRNTKELFLIPSLDEIEIRSRVSEVLLHESLEYGLSPDHPMCVGRIDDARTIVDGIRDMSGMVYSGVFKPKSVFSERISDLGVLPVFEYTVWSAIERQSKSIFVCPYGISNGVTETPRTPSGFVLLSGYEVDESVLISETIKEEKRVLVDNYGAREKGQNMELCLPTDNGIDTVEVNIDDLCSQMCLLFLKNNGRLVRFIDVGLLSKKLTNDITPAIYSKFALRIRWVIDPKKKEEVEVLFDRKNDQDEELTVDGLRMKRRAELAIEANFKKLIEQKAFCNNHASIDEKMSQYNTVSNDADMNCDFLYCRKCGKRLLADSLFCNYCGTRVESISQKTIE